MKNIHIKFVAVILAIVLAVSLYGNATASGGKVRGDVGQGSVNQYQVVPPWWAIP